MGKSKIGRIISRMEVHLASGIRRLRNPKKYKTLSFFRDMLGDSVSLNEEAEAIKDTVLTQICTFDSSCFSKNCACLIYINPVYKKENYHVSHAGIAKRKGACVMISDRSIPGFPCIVSDNPVATYARLCRYYRDLSDRLSVVFVSGSIGKTTTKNMVAEVMKMGYRTSYASSNYNTKTELGFAAQHLPKKADYLIQEVHEGEPGETKYLAEIFRPELFVLTPIDYSHFTYFGDSERIIAEVCSITEGMSPDGSVIVNVDEFDRFDLLNGRHVISISLKNENADYYACDIMVEAEGVRFRIIEKGTGEKHEVRLNHIYATHNVSCALSAYAAGRYAKISPQDIITGLSHFKTTGFRQNVMEVDGVIIYADCYNAVERSVKSAIDTSDIMSVSGKRIAVLGDIEEAGEMSEQMHRNVASMVNASRFDILVAYGKKMKTGILSTECRDSLRVECFDNLEDLSAAIKKSVRPGDMVLFKASHSSHLEQCIVKVWPKIEKTISKASLAAERWRRTSLYN